MAGMSPLDYKYTLEQCDVAAERRAQLKEYRAFRAKCIEMLRGKGAASVTTQMHDLAWDTAVFQTLNEARRLEPGRQVNGPMWGLLTNGYVSRMVLGIRRLVDPDETTTGLGSILAKIRKKHVLLTRENYVCHDGLPFDPAPARDKFYDSKRLEMGRHTAFWLESEGPGSFATSERAHEDFDMLCDASPSTGTRDERLSLEVLDRLEAALKSDEIKRVRRLANKRFAHSEHLKPASEARLTITFNDLEEALRQIAVVANFVSANIFFDAMFGSLVPVSREDQLGGLDLPWVATENLPALAEHWSALEERLNQWAYDAGREFYPARP